ncbi:RDD family protein [Glutamicibacter endophyticus]|uniref:RDD family protein n=1 Tax=Glutamicibacter endophyticus TaxID=1522174 RepID=UPI003AF09692
MAQTMNLVDASATQRLLSWLLDSVPLIILAAIFMPIISSKLLQAAVDPQILGQIAGTYLLFGVLSLAYTVGIWWWEATSGKTPGQFLLKLRTTNLEGNLPGWGKVIGRRLLIAVAGIIPVVGPVLMVISNLFDANGKRQGWHDKAAGTLVLDVAAGRDPLTSGGIAGPQSFAPQDDPSPAQPESHDEDERAVDAPEDPEDVPEFAGPAVIDSVPGAIRQANEEPSPAKAEVISEVNAAAPASAPVPEHADPDDELGSTRLRVERDPVMVLHFDDGQALTIEHSALIGRNPAPAEGEQVDELISLDDPERTVSKTHLLVQSGASGLWVTDRQSANGSYIVDGQGGTRDLVPGQPQQVSPGQTVYFGERNFKVERA